MNIADLIVTFEYLPKTIIHKYTVWWYGGDFLCKVGRFFDMFGVSLSSSILVCMCVDRLIAISHPLYNIRGPFKHRIMLFIAWAVSLIISTPQVSYQKLKAFS
ncbi:hypothetical protein AB6A40_007183 [Gnathostoma spinigerum]|uniref:G-protein coupled receptors family 1 profile domain-containing protein n=1 Tax=Gnathostoma spinigerum TaxID=75299 RepID=A0ABD6EKH6_9BILA